MEPAERLQLHLVLPFRQEVRDHPQVQAHLAGGWRVVQLQRVTDHEVLVTLTRDVKPA